MKAASVSLERRTSLVDRLGDYVELTKPRIGALVLVTVAAGSILASPAAPDPWLIVHAVIGTALVAAGSSVFNQLAERQIDARMRRTADRPLPAGRVLPAEALALGISLSIAGLIYLALLVNVLAFALAALSLVLYSFIYTPMKRITSLNTVIGAIPGALPPVIGWAAIRGDVGPEAWILFGLLFFWQFPHFFAIAWLYREDYKAGGIQMLPVSAQGQRIVGVVALAYALALAPVSLLPSLVGLAGPAYFWAAMLLGAQFAAYVGWFLIRPGDARARLLMWASLVYLPAVMGMLVLDRVRLWT